MNSFKGFIKNIADKAELTSTTPSASPQRPSAGDSSDWPSPLTDGQEGFICPACHGTFGSPDDLQAHFEAQHASEASLNAAKRTEGRFGDLKDEVSDLQRTLKEEQFYSTELKRQVEALNESVLGSGLGRAQPPDPGPEWGPDHIYALQEGKRLLTEEVLNLRQQLSDSQLTAREKEKLIERAAQLASENVELKSLVDEMKSQKSTWEDRLALMEKELSNRNSVDDAHVLQMELIQVQKMMDEMNREKDQEIDRLQAELKQVHSSHRDLTDQRIQDLQTELENTKNVELADLQSKLNDQLHVIEELQTQLDQSQTDTLNKNNELESLRDQLKAAEMQMNHLTNTQLSDSEKLGLEMQWLQDKLSTEQGKANDLSQELSVLQTHYDDQCQINDELKGQVLEQTSQISDFQRTMGIRQEDISRFQSEIEVLKNGLEKMSAEKEDLLLKIEAGEGVNTALQQLKEENISLTNQVKSQESNHKKLMEESAKKVETLHTQLSESTKATAMAQEKLSKLEQNLDERTVKLEHSQNAIAKLEADLQSKSELLHASETAKSTQRQELEGQSRLIQASLTDKTAECERLAEQVETLENTATAERSRLEEALEATERDKDEAISSLTNKYQALEAKAREQESTLSEAQRNAKILQDQLEDMKSAKAGIESQQQEMKARVQSIQMDKAEIEAENQALKVSLAEARQVNEALQSSEKERNVAVQNLQTQLEAAVQKESQAKATIKDLKDKEQDLLSTLDDQVAMLSSLKLEAASKVAAMSTELETSKLDKAQLEEDIARLRRDLDAMSLELDAGETKICKLQSLLEQEKLESHGKIADLSKAKELLLSAKVELQSRLEDAQNEMTAKENKLAQIGTDFESQRAVLEHKSLELQRQMESQKQDHIQALEALQEENAKLRDEISSQIIHLEEGREKLKSEKGHSLELNAQLDAALSAKLEMEAQLGSASDERKSLLERCLLAENELERSRGTVLELRRKLDDSQAALHELGRENQSIQVELAKQTGRKWADDSEVTQCQGCSGPFTLTNRKHHCRNCGQIFCAECSAKQAPMANYKKPQRVCDQCHSELQ